MVKNPPANTGDTASIPGSERSPGEGNGNPLQYSCLQNRMDRGAWRATSPWSCKRVRRDLAIKQQLTNRVSGDQDHKDSFYNTLLLIQVGVFSKIREKVIKVEVNIWVKYLEMCQ